MTTANDNPRILFLDIETKLMEVYSFGIRDQYLQHTQIKSHGGISCVGIKWHGERKATVFSEWDHGYDEMLRQVHAHLCEADAVATYNGARFDLPKLNGAFLVAGMTPPPPPTQIDIFKTARKMGFPSSKLDYIAPLLGLGSKVKHEGMPLWIKVLNGDPKAQAKMSRYCAGDVRLTEAVYERVKPFIADHPHMRDTSRDACGSCGSTRMQSRGVRRTKAMHIARLQCQACGSWASGKRTKAA